MGALTTAAALSAAGGVALAARWALRRTDGLGRPVRFPVVGVAALLVLAGIAAVPDVRRHRLEGTLSRVASVLAERPVEVRCQTLGSALVDVGRHQGFVRWGPDGRPEPVANVDRRQCQLLRDFLSSDGAARPFEEQLAVHLLTHEAMHTAGETSEQVTECRAVQRDAVTAELLGAAPAHAAALARAYWTRAYPRMPADYRSPDCGPGLPMDEGLASAPW